MTLKVDFSDFWPGFIKTDNYFYNLLSKHYEVIISERPDILFFSCYGQTYLAYNCVRIFYSAENMRPDFTGCDYALSFDFLDDPRHYRLPLYALYIDQKNKMEDLLLSKSKSELQSAWAEKKKFCCIVVSNPRGKERTDFFHRLSRYKKVDSGGQWMNNVGGAVKDKLEFIKDYRFVVAFENSSFPGYTTEKILEPLFQECIPLYWGNPLVGRDFNTGRFVNSGDCKNVDEMIERVVHLENSAEAAVDMLLESKFPEGRIPEYIRPENVFGFLHEIVGRLHSIVPVAVDSGTRMRHMLNRKNLSARHYVGKLFGRNFR